MKKLLFFSLLLSANMITAQDKIPFQDAEEIYERASESINTGDFNQTLEILDEVNPNDSLYCATLVSKTYYLLQVQKFEETVKVADEGLQRNCAEENLSFFVNKGVANVNLGNLEEGLKIYEEALEMYPKKSILWYNKGVVLDEMGRTEDAITSLQNAILYNPIYPNPHLRLGDIAYKQERMAQAIMCYNFFLLLQSDGANSFSVLQNLNSTVSAKNPNVAQKDFQLSPDAESFKEIDLILNNKIALNENYDTGNEINIAIVKQTHALLEQLKKYKGDEGFWAKTYVPLYQWVMKEDLFDEMIYTMNYSIENEHYKKIIEKNLKGVNSFITNFSEKWASILSEPNFRTEEEDKGLHYIYSTEYLQAVGDYTNQETKGDWRFYDMNGSLSAKGNFNKNAEKEGKWVWFFGPEKIKETAIFKDGKINGKNLYYFPNGRLNISAQFVNGVLSGKYDVYESRGALEHTKVFKNDMLDGKYTSYFDAGETLPEFDIIYKEDKIEGTAYEYYVNGDVFAEMPFKNNNRHGLEKKFYPNKQLMSETNYMDGILHGPYKAYYSNSQLQKTGNFSNGENEGTWKTYYSNGQLESEYSHKGGVIDGLVKFYDRDGKMYYEYDYNKGTLVAYRFYDKSGKTIAEDKKRGGDFYYTSYSPLGKKTSEGVYDVKGGKKGEWKYYSNKGVLTEKGNYNDNLAEGQYFIFYANGEKESVSTYVNDTLSGYFVSYFMNKNMKSQGWYKDGQQHGEWRNYYIDGTLESINYFHNGDYHGEQQYFSCDGALETVSTFEFGEIMEDKFYTINEEILDVIDYEKPNGSYTLVTKHANGKVFSKTSFLNGIRHGLYEKFNFYGDRILTGNYLNGSQDGEWQWFYDNGQLKEIQNYSKGRQNGEFKRFYENGKIEDKGYYDYGSLSGALENYHENGQLSTTVQYVENLQHGRKEFYDESGALQLVRFYDNGSVIGYTYLGTDSKELPMTPITNETAKIVAYYDNGKVSREMEYKNGLFVGDYKIYFYNGTLQEQIDYEDGYYNGKNTTYFSDGKIKMEREFLYDQLQGVSTKYYENGNKKEEINYINDIKSGNAIFYNEKGEPIKKEQYFDGSIYAATTI